MFCSKHVDVKRNSVYFPEIKKKKNICRIFFGFEFISFPNRGVLSAAPCIYFFSTNISTEYFKHGAHSPFFSSKCRLFRNATFFGFCVIHILHTGCAKI